MDIKQILALVKEGTLPIDEAESMIKYKPFDDIGDAVIDYNRKLRTGRPEVIYGEGKTVEQIKKIVLNMKQNEAATVLATRINREKFEAIKEVFEEAVFFEAARIASVCLDPTPKKNVGKIAVVSAGTSDIAVCEEAAVTAEFFGNEVTRVYDVGVAGLHRLLNKLDVFDSATVIIVVAGMEGALASVVGGLTNKPVIAVPTSVGYGAAFGGIAALLSMLNSCASGVGVVNIDNGFGAAVLADSIVSAISQFE